MKLTTVEHWLGGKAAVEYGALPNTHVHARFNCGALTGMSMWFPLYESIDRWRLVLANARADFLAAREAQMQSWTPMNPTGPADRDADGNPVFVEEDHTAHLWPHTSFTSG